MGGILFLFKPLHSIYVPKTWIASQVWSILAVSMVAQIATFPLSLYYFHRFPNYFLLSNLLVIPLGTIVIFGGIIVLFFSWWPLVALFLGKFLSFLIQLLNTSVSMLGNLPGSSTESIYLSMLGMSLLYFAIIIMANYFLKVRPLYFLYFLFVLIIFHGFILIEKSRSMQQKFMIVYHSPRQSYIQFFQGRKVISICDSLLSTNALLRKRVSENYLLERRVSDEIIVSTRRLSSGTDIYGDLIVRMPFVQFGRDRMYILFADNEKLKPDSSLLDYILVSSNPKVKPDSWLEGVKCKTVIVDASNSAWKIDAWKTACEKRGIAFVNVAESGAFIVKK